MNKTTLKIDLDVETREEAIIIIVERIKYFKNIFDVQPSYFKKIELLKKSRYSAKIELAKPVKDIKSVVILQLVFGSDWRKEINTFYNAEALGMKYANRLFTSKYYKGHLISAEIEDVTDLVYHYVRKGGLIKINSCTTEPLLVRIWNYFKKW